MLREIIAVEAGISRFRSTSNNWQDYLPILRYLPFSDKTTSAEEYRVRRDDYMDKLLSQLKNEIKDGTDISCITGNILKDPEAKLNEGLISYFLRSLTHYSRGEISLFDHGIRWS